MPRKFSSIKKKKDIAVSIACNNNSSQWKSQMDNISFAPENNLVLQDCLETTPSLVLKSSITMNNKNERTKMFFDPD